MYKTFTRAALFLLLVCNALGAQSLLKPSEICGTYLSVEPKNREASKVALMNWLDANRDSDAYEIHHDGEYSRVAEIIREVDGESAVDSFLVDQLERTTGRRSRYAILQTLARRNASAGSTETAIELWTRARDTMMGLDHAYYTTRQALPLIEIARLHLAAGRNDEARQAFENYVASDYGSTEANGVYIDLGNLYEEAGDWEKARALYQHYAAISYYAKDKELQRRVAYPKDETLVQAGNLIEELRSANPSGRRILRNSIYELIAAAPSTDPWLRWLDRVCAEETDPAVRTELDVLLPWLTPIAKSPSRLRQSDVTDRIKRQEMNEPRLRVHNELIETLLASLRSTPYKDAAHASLGGPHKVGDLASDPGFRKALEKAFLYLKHNLTVVSSNRPADQATSEADAMTAGVIDLLRDAESLGGYLRAQVKHDDDIAGWAALFLYMLGNKDDVDLILEHLPDNAYQRNQSMVFLADALYREGTVDIPHVIGLDKVYVRDWWSESKDGPEARERFQTWWAAEKSRFDYKRRLPRGALLQTAGMTDRMTSFQNAPELGGVFVTLEGGFLDYSGSVWFFAYDGKQSGPITMWARDSAAGTLGSAKALWSEGRHAVSQLSNLQWLPDQLACAFNVSDDKRLRINFEGETREAVSLDVLPYESGDDTTVASLGPPLQRQGAITFEIRQGDLFAVNEDTGNEVCIEDFGYILSFAIDPDAHHILTLYRGILSDSLNAYDVSKAVQGL